MYPKAKSPDYGVGLIASPKPPPSVKQRGRTYPLDIPKLAPLDLATDSTD